MIQENIKCNKCGSMEHIKAGFTVKKRQYVQRYRCKKCLKIFTPVEEMVNMEVK